MRSALTPIPTREETDRRMLEWLRAQTSHFAVGGGNRNFADSIIARFAELIEDQAQFKHSLATLQDAHKLAMAQMQFAQSVVKQLERLGGQLESAKDRNGNRALPPAPASEAEPAVDLKGE